MCRAESSSLLKTASSPVRHLDVASVVRLAHISDFYPTVTLTTGSPRVKFNFGKSPFFFDFERYVQVELASLLQAIEQEPLSKHSITKMILEYTKHHGYRKTAEKLEHTMTFDEVSHDKTVNSKPSRPTHQRSHRPLTRRSHDGIELREKTSKVRSDLKLVSNPPSRFQAQAASKKAHKTLDISTPYYDPTCTAQRGLIRSLITSGRLLEAEKLIEVFLPGLLADPCLKIQLLVLRFLQTCLNDPMTAVLLAKSHFSGENKDLPFYFRSSDNIVLSAPVKV